MLSQLAQRDKALEINTRRLVTPDAREALLPVYHRFRELGGRLVTIGSDAHNAQDIGRGMDIALEMAAVCGLTPVYFKERKPIALK